MNLTLIRAHENEHGTFGVLLVNGSPFCVTLENRWLNNQRNISCIPEGIYQAYRHNGVKYKNVWALANVPNRTAILIHAGNTDRDTQGCILVGKSFGKLSGKDAILQSQAALIELRNILPDNFTITIRR